MWQVLLKGRPPIKYDVLSIDIGSAPKPVPFLPHGAKGPARAKSPSSANKSPSRAKSPQPVGGAATGAAAGACITPVKPIDGFCRQWDAIVARVLAMARGAVCRLVVVGAGAGGVELALSMQARLSKELRAAGRDAGCLCVTLLARSEQVLPQHSRGVRTIFERLLRERDIKVLSRCEVTLPHAYQSPHGTAMPTPAQPTGGLERRGAPALRRRAGRRHAARHTVRRGCVLHAGRRGGLAARDAARPRRARLHRRACLFTYL